VGHLGMVLSRIWVNTVNYVEITEQLSGIYTSDLKEIKFGVPQGSVHCLHFNELYIHGLPIYIQGQRLSCLLMIHIPI